MVGGIDDRFGKDAGGLTHTEGVALKSPHSNLKNRGSAGVPLAAYPPVVFLTRPTWHWQQAASGTLASGTLASGTLAHAKLAGAMQSISRMPLRPDTPGCVCITCRRNAPIRRKKSTDFPRGRPFLFF